MSPVIRAHSSFDEAKKWLTGLLQAKPSAVAPESPQPEEPSAPDYTLPSTLDHVLLKEGTYWVDDDYGPGWEAKCQDRTDDPTNAQWVSSKLVGGRHAPILDIDLAARLLPSRTSGHSHLYLDAPMSWRRYKQLLRALAQAGIVEQDWVKASIKGRRTVLRTPWRVPGTAPVDAYDDIVDRHVMLATFEYVEQDGYFVSRYRAYGHTNDRSKAEVVSSELRSGKQHAPALDIDIPAALVPSTTPGHHHLYLDVAMSWRDYRRLLRALAKAGVIEQSWAKASIASENTVLSVPWRVNPKAARR